MLAPPLILGIVAGVVFHRPGLTQSSLRIVGAVGFATVTTAGLKLVAGRSRPSQVAGDPDEFRLFSGRNSFPSGHTTVAFAAAAALDRETHSAWVPWVAYPLAGAVGWSRIHDEKHWASDVAAGAVVGYFAAHYAENFMRSGEPGARRWGMLLEPVRGMRVGARLKF